MLSRRTQAALVFVMLITGSLVVSGLRAEYCSNWQVRKLEQAPTWYTVALAKPPASKELQINDSLARLDYVLNDSVSILQYKRRQRSEYGDLWYDGSGSLYLCARDTALLDSSDYRFSNLSFDCDTSVAVTARGEYVTPDGDYGTSIVMYNLKSRERKVLHPHLDMMSAPPQFSPHSPMLVYSDFGDVYVYYSGLQSAELVFQRGGGYAREGPCSVSWIDEIRWSADGKSFVFKYFISSDHSEIWEARWSKDLDTAEDSTR